MKKLSILLFAAAALMGGCEESADTDRVIPVTSISLDATLAGGISLEVGQTAEIAGKATVLPENATDRSESYESSDPAIAAVDAAGRVTALEPGLAMITVTVGGRHAHFEVRVEARTIPVEQVTLPEEWRDGCAIRIGETLDIAGKAIVTPADATYTEESYSSSAPTVASVSQEGLVTGLAVGEATLTITVGGKQASFLLTVGKIAVERVVLPEAWTRGVTLELGHTLDLAGKATVEPENATYTDESYSSSQTDVASVDDKGVVTALKIGTTTITVTVDGVEASFDLVVEHHIPVEQLLLPEEWQEGLTLLTGETHDIAGHVTILPETATNRTESYSSSQPDVASVDDEGLVTALTAGTTTITITVDGVEASFTLTVTPTPVPIEKITLARQTASVVLAAPGQTQFDLYAQLAFTPADQNEGVRYIAYNEEIATVDAEGIVTCKAVGTATFVVFAADNENYKDTDRKVIFSLNITDPHDCDRTGWSVSAASGPIRGTGGSETAPFDDAFCPNFYGTDTGTNFGLTRPGKTNKNPAESVPADARIWFVVDMQQPRAVNYFRIKHLSCRNSDRGTRWWKFVEILGSDTGEEGSWVSVATDVAVPEEAKANSQQIDPNDGGSRNLDHYRDTPNVKFPKANYRYLKFVADKNCFTGTTTTVQFGEFYLGLDE